MSEILMFLAGFVLGGAIIYASMHFHLVKLEGILEEIHLKYESILNAISEWQKKI